MKATIVPALNGRWEVREVPAPVPGPNQVVIRIRASRSSSAAGSWARCRTARFRAVITN